MRFLCLYKPGEFLAAVVAGTAIFHAIGYYMHSGGHGTIPPDWDQYPRFLEMPL
jgi:hypothetical protein